MSHPTTTAWYEARTAFCEENGRTDNDIMEDDVGEYVFVDSGDDSIGDFGGQVTIRLAKLYLPESLQSYYEGEATGRNKEAIERFEEENGLIL